LRRDGKNKKATKNYYEERLYEKLGLKDEDEKVIEEREACDRRGPKLLTGLFGPKLKLI
jgi:hypothetical protein